MALDKTVRFLSGWGLPLAYGALIFYLSHQPTVPGPALPVSDKVLHVFEYAILGFLLARALTKSGVSNIITRGQVEAAVESVTESVTVKRGSFEANVTRRGLWAVALAALYGVSDEWHQSFIPGRSPEFADWLADLAGAFLGVFIFYLAGRFRAKTQNISR